MKLHSDRYAQNGPFVRFLQQARHTCSHTKAQQPSSPSQNEPASMPRRKVSKCKTLFMICFEASKGFPQNAQSFPNDPHAPPRHPQGPPNAPKFPEITQTSLRDSRRGWRQRRLRPKIHILLHAFLCLCFCATPLRSGLVQRVTCPSLTCATVSRSLKRRRSATSPTHPGNHLATPSWLGPLIVVLLVSRRSRTLSRFSIGHSILYCA